MVLYFAHRYKEGKLPPEQIDWRGFLRRISQHRATGIWEDEIEETGDIGVAPERPTKALTREEAIESELPEVLSEKDIDEYIDRLVSGVESIDEGRDRIKTEIKESQPDLADEEIETILALMIDAPARALGMTPDEFVDSLHYHKENRP